MKIHRYQKIMNEVSDWSVGLETVTGEWLKDKSLPKWESWSKNQYSAWELGWRELKAAKSKNIQKNCPQQNKLQTGKVGNHYLQGVVWLTQGHPELIIF